MSRNIHNSSPNSKVSYTLLPTLPQSSVKARKDSYCESLRPYPTTSITSSILRLRRLPLLRPLSISLSSVVALVHDKVLGTVVLAAGEVRLEDRLGAGGVALLGIERGTRHVRDGGVAGGAAPVLVGGGTEGVILWCGLGEPDVAAVAAELAGGEGFGDVFLDDDGAAGGVDEP
jgi:hypothetical protein